MTPRRCALWSAGFASENLYSPLTMPSSTPCSRVKKFMKSAWQRYTMPIYQCDNLLQSVSRPEANHKTFISCKACFGCHDHWHVCAGLPSCLGLFRHGHVLVVGGNIVDDVLVLGQPPQDYAWTLKIKTIAHVENLSPLQVQCVLPPHLFHSIFNDCGHFITEGRIVALHCLKHKDNGLCMCKSIVECRNGLKKDHCGTQTLGREDKTFWTQVDDALRDRERDKDTISMFWPSFSLQASQVQKRNWASQSDKQGVPILARTTLAFDLSVCMSKCRSLIHQGNPNTYSPCERCLMLQSLSIERCASISCTNKETSRTCISSLPNAVANLGMEKQWRRKRGFKKAMKSHQSMSKKDPKNSQHVYPTRTAVLNCMETK